MASPYYDYLMGLGPNPDEPQPPLMPTGVPQAPMGLPQLLEAHPTVFPQPRPAPPAGTGGSGPPNTADFPAPTTAPTAFGPDAPPAPAPAPAQQQPTPVQPPPLSPVQSYLRNTLGLDPEFAAAQKQSQFLRSLAQLGQGSNTIANAIATRGGTRPSQAVGQAGVKQAYANAERPLQDLEAARQNAGQALQLSREMALDDLNSQETANARTQVRLLPKIAAQIPNVNHMSARQIYAMLPNLMKVATEQREESKDANLEQYRGKELEQGQKRLDQQAKEAEARLAETHAQHGLTAELMRDRLNRTDSKQDDKLWTEFDNAISRSRGRANLAADDQKRLEAIERLKSYAFDENGNPKKLNPQQVEAAMMDFASVMAGGNQATESAIKSQVPHTWKGSMAKTLEYFTNHPQDAGAQDFLRVLGNQAGEMGTTINEQVLKHQAATLPRYIKRLRAQDPARFDDLLTSNQIPVSRVDLERGLLKPAQTGIVKIANDDEFNSLPSGTKFVGPDGKTRVKP